MNAELEAYLRAQPAALRALDDLAGQYGENLMCVLAPEPLPPGLIVVYVPLAAIAPDGAIRMLDDGRCRRDVSGEGPAMRVD